MSTDGQLRSARNALIDKALKLAHAWQTQEGFDVETVDALSRASVEYAVAREKRNKNPDPVETTIMLCGTMIRAQVAGWREAGSSDQEILDALNTLIVARLYDQMEAMDAKRSRSRSGNRDRGDDATLRLAGGTDHARGRAQGGPVDPAEQG